MWKQLKATEIDPSRKSHNASDKYPTNDNATFCNRNVHISVTKCCIVGYGTSALQDLSNKHINSVISSEKEQELISVL